MTPAPLAGPPLGGRPLVKAGGVMAKRVLNRRQLRVEADQAALAESAPKAATPAPAKPGKPARAPRKPAAKKVKEPERLRARWGLFDNAMKRVATFDYCERAAADLKLADLNARKAGA